MSANILSSRFSPRLVPPERLEALFVGGARRRLVQRLVDDLFSSRDAGGGRYEVVVGPRGAGKSHLLGLVSHRLRTDPRRGELCVAELGEEEHPSGYVDLLARTLSSLPEEEGLPAPASQVAALRRTPRGEQEAAAETMLRARVGGRPLVLLAENLDRVFSAIGVQGQQRLRRLMHDARWSLIATSCTWGSAFTDAKAPFYNGLTRNPLPEFSDEDAIAMVLNLARAHGDDELADQLQTGLGRARLRGMRLLLGGNPRAMALLFPFLRERRLDDLEGTFLDLSEELTPYFQDQMSRLPDGQRPYLEHLAGNWTPMSVGELAELTFATPQTASGQLRYLKRDQLVLGHSFGRESFYEIGEPLHRLALCMKRPDRAPAALARMAAAWMARDEIEQRWTALGAVMDGADPWYLALNLVGEPGSKYEAALVDELDRMVAAGKREEALERAEQEWHARHMELVGLWLTSRMQPANEAIVLDMLKRCRDEVAVAAALLQGWNWSKPVSTVLQAAVRRLAEAGDPDAALALVTLPDMPADGRSLWVQRARSGARELPGLTVDAIVGRLALQGRLREAWSLFGACDAAPIALPTRLALLLGAKVGDAVLDLDEAQWLEGLHGASSELVLACLRHLQGRQDESARLAQRASRGLQALPREQLYMTAALLPSLLEPAIILSVLHPAFGRYSTDPVASIILGVALFSADRFADAEPYIARSRQTRPNDRILNYFHAIILAHLGRWPEAIEAARTGDPPLLALLESLHAALVSPTDHAPALHLPPTHGAIARAFCVSVIAAAEHDLPRWTPLLTALAAAATWQPIFLPATLGAFASQWTSPLRPGLQAIVDLLAHLLPDAREVAMLQAICALPTDTRPFLLLAAPERVLLRKMAHDQPDAAALRAALPEESSGEE